MIAITLNVAGSVAVTPTSIACISRVSPNAATRPTAMPIALKRNPWPTTSSIYARALRPAPCVHQCRRALPHGGGKHAIEPYTGEYPCDDREQGRSGTVMRTACPLAFFVHQYGDGLNIGNQEIWAHLPNRRPTALRKLAGSLPVRIAHEATRSPPTKASVK